MYRLNILFDKVMQQDGMKHFIAGVILASFLKLFMPLILVFVCVTAIVIAKELVYDKDTSQGSPEPRDVFWGIVGTLFGVL